MPDCMYGSARWHKLSTPRRQQPWQLKQVCVGWASSYHSQHDATRICCWAPAPAAIDRYLLQAPRSAVDQPHAAAAAVDRRDRQTDGRTPHTMRAASTKCITVCRQSSSSTTACCDANQAVLYSRTTCVNSEGWRTGELEIVHSPTTKRSKHRRCRQLCLTNAFTTAILSTVQSRVNKFYPQGFLVIFPQRLRILK